MKKGHNSAELKDGEVQVLDIPDTNALVTMEVPEEKMWKSS